MTMRPTPRLPALALPALLLLAACGSPSYYLVPPAATGGPRVGGGAGGIAVADMNLPTYAETVEIASLDPAGAVTLDKGALWADTPRRALTRHLIAALQARLSAQIASEPWPAYDAPGLRVEVFVDRMIGAPEGPFQFSGQYVLVSPASGRIVSTDRFAITTQAGPGPQGLVAAHARAVEALADQIAARVTGRPVG
jgi:uncharacterized lipoprotein YmbA